MNRPLVAPTGHDLPLRFPEPMRIVQVSPSYFPCIGGCERRVQAVSERLVRRGHEVTVLTLDVASQRDFTSQHGAGLPATELLNGVQLIRVSPSGGRLVALHGWLLRRRGGWRTTTGLLGDEFGYVVGTPSGLGVVRPLLRLDADIVTIVNWHFGTAFWGVLATRLRRLPQVAVPVLHIDQAWAQKPVYRRMFKACRATIVATQAEAEFVRARGATSVTVAGGGVEPKRFEHRDGAAIRARYHLGARLVVGFVGRQDTLKGVPTLLEAMQTVWREMPDTVLILAGQKSHRDRTVSDRLAALPPSQAEKVILIDDFPDHDGPSIVDACDLLAQPSVEESFGQVLLEAWLCGKPVIGADIAATRLVIDHGVNGWLVKPFDAPDLAAKVLSLLTDPERRAEFGRRGQEKALAQYTWDQVTDKWEATFRQVLAQ